MPKMSAPKILPSIPRPGLPTPPPDRPKPVAPAPGLSRFETALRYVLVNEDGKPLEKDDGCFTNNPKDPGGATKWGIILTEYAEYLGKPFSVEDVRAAPFELARSIYLKKFWGPIDGDSITDLGLATAIFDTAVNKGMGGTVRLLQRLFSLPEDGHMGPVTLKAINAQDPHAFIATFEVAVEKYIGDRITRFSNMEWARKGWMNRAKRLLGLD